MDEITYYIKKDENTGLFYIRAGFPLTYITDNTGKREINRIAKAMRQLGFTVVDMTKAVQP